MQISTGAGRLARLVRLTVVQPVANIRGSGVYHVERGSAMRLTCAVQQVRLPNTLLAAAEGVLGNSVFTVPRNKSVLFVFFDWSCFVRQKVLLKVITQ